MEQQTTKSGNYEYVQITVIPDRVSVLPYSAQSKLAEEAAKGGGGAVAAVNKMAENGYCLLPMSVASRVEDHITNACYVLFMAREVSGWQG
jgi:hypothetical protein